MGSSFTRRAGYIILSEESMPRSGAWLVRAGEPFRFPGEDIFLGKKIRPSALPAPLFRSPAMNTLTPVQFGCIVVSTCSGLPYRSQAWITLRAEVAPATSLFSFFRGHLTPFGCSRRGDAPARQNTWTRADQRTVSITVDCVPPQSVGQACRTGRGQRRDEGHEERVPLQCATSPAVTTGATGARRTAALVCSASEIG